MVFQSVKMAWKSIASNKMRSFLTMLGIIIGVISLVVLVSLVSGATTSVTDEIDSIGSNLLTVSISDNKGKPMKLSDVDALMDEEEIALAAPGASLSVTGKYGSESDTVMVTGTTAAYSEIQGLSMKYGRFLKRTDVDNVNYVAVVNETFAEELVGYTACVGEKVHFNGLTFTIIGVLDEENSSSMTSMMGDQLMAYIPYTTAIRVSNTVSTEVTSFYAAPSDENSMDAAENRLTTLMMDRLNEDEDAFSITNQSEIMEALSSVTDTLSLLLGGIAAISLLVGGVSFCLNTTVVGVSIIFSLAIGMIFGMYPANKAATMLPIDALRFEGEGNCLVQIESLANETVKRHLYRKNDFVKVSFWLLLLKKKDYLLLNVEKSGKLYIIVCRFFDH